MAYETAPFFLTEGAVGTRLAEEFGLAPDEYIDKAALLYDKAGRRALESIYGGYLQVAEDDNLPLMLMTNTRRANRERMALADRAYQNVIADYTKFLRELAGKHHSQVYIGGIMGCRGGAYTGAGALTREEAVAFHSRQAEQMAQAGVDFVFAAIMPSVEETVGLSQAVAAVELPYIVSFMLGRSGRLPDGHFLHRAMQTVEEAMGAQRPLGYMANCIHPAILQAALQQPDNKTELVRMRFHGIQANGANAEPEELEGAAVAIANDGPEELAESLRQLCRVQPMKVMGGCCGTDVKHIEAIASLAGEKL